jgi:hypothetical protein
MKVSTEVIFIEYLRGLSAKADWRTVDQERATHRDAFARSRFLETNIAIGLF